MSKIKKLLSLYSKIPDIECKGLCYASCTIVPAAKIESKRAKERLGFNPFNPLYYLHSLKKESKIPVCRALKDNRCSIYSIRPGVCRLYGVAEGLECPFGCEPKGKLPKDEVFDIIRKIEEL